MTPRIDPAIKEKSKITKEEWREYTKTVWTIANTSRNDHPAVFPEEIPRRLIKLFSFYGTPFSIHSPEPALPHVLLFLSDGVQLASTRMVTTSGR